MGFNDTFIGRYFKMNDRKTTLGTEIVAGLSTFLTLAYILAVNPAILADSGGTCHTCTDYPNDSDCIPNQFQPFFLPAIFTPAYEACQQEVRRDLVIVTAGMSALACFVMGVAANLPFALAPGMGLNAYFTYTIVGFRGSGPVEYETALGVVFIEGIVFMVIAALGIRSFIVKAIPTCILRATTGGIGLFLATLGLQTAEGIGLIVSDTATGMTMGGCKPEHRVPMYACPSTKGIPGLADGIDMAGPGTIGAWGETSTNLAAYRAHVGNPGAYPWEACLKGTPNVYTCDEIVDAGSKVRLGGLRQPALQSPTCFLGLLGLMLCGFRYARKWKGAIIITVLFCSIISWIKVDPPDGPTGVEYWSMGGDWEYFKKVVEARGAPSVAGKLKFDNWSGVGDALFMFWFVDFMDTSGTLYAMAEYANLLDAKGNFEGQYAAFLVDGFATSIGALCGTSPVTTYIESAPGILEGGRTGLTAVVVSLCFGVSIFFAPIFASIPPWCTGFALVVVGAMMCKGITKINWEDAGEAIPAFFLLVTMPLTYNIGYGLFAGWISWIIINGLSFCVDLILKPSESIERKKKEFAQYIEDGKAGLPCFMSKTPLPTTTVDDTVDATTGEHP